MSVVFATYAKDFIVLCADKQATNMNNQKIISLDIQKIEKWGPTTGIAFAGNYVLSTKIKDVVFNYIKNEGFDKFSLEEIADLLCQGYYACKDEYPDLPTEVVAKFALAGILSNGSVGVIEIIVGNDKTEFFTNEAKDIPETLILSPEDCSSDECNDLFKRAIVNAKKKCKYYQDPMELAHKKAVKYVSEHSKYVSAKADYIKFSF